MDFWPPSFNKKQLFYNQPFVVFYVTVIHRKASDCFLSILADSIIHVQPLKAVWYHYVKWRKSKLWEKIQAELLKKLRKACQRNPRPYLGIIDSQTVKTVQKGGAAVMMQVKKARVENDIL